MSSSSTVLSTCDTLTKKETQANLCGFIGCENFCKINFKTCEKHIQTLQLFDKPDECVICTESISELEFPLSCGHWIHRECQLKFKETCSYCRQNILLSNDEKQTMELTNKKHREYEEKQNLELLRQLTLFNEDDDDTEDETYEENNQQNNQQNNDRVNSEISHYDYIYFQMVSDIIEKKRNEINDNIHFNEYGLLDDLSIGYELYIKLIFATSNNFNFDIHPFVKYLVKKCKNLLIDSLDQIQTIISPFLLDEYLTMFILERVQLITQYENNDVFKNQYLNVKSNIFLKDLISHITNCLQ